MNQERLKLWLDALRSGEYQQTSGVLNSNDRYCCLGVLCEVAIKNGLQISRTTRAREFPDGADPLKVIRYDGMSTYPSAVVMEWLGHNPALDIKVTHETADGRIAVRRAVTGLNDDDGWDFNEIADALEATYAVKEEVAA